MFFYILIRLLLWLISRASRLQNEIREFLLFVDWSNLMITVTSPAKQTPLISQSYIMTITTAYPDNKLILLQYLLEVYALKNFASFLFLVITFLVFLMT